MKRPQICKNIVQFEQESRQMPCCLTAYTGSDGLIRIDTGNTQEQTNSGKWRRISGARHLVSSSTPTQAWRTLGETGPSVRSPPSLHILERES